MKWCSYMYPFFVVKRDVIIKLEVEGLLVWIALPILRQMKQARPPDEVPTNQYHNTFSVGLCWASFSILFYFILFYFCSFSFFSSGE